MNYIWEVLAEADRQGRDRDKIRFIPAVNPSPYLETSFENLNEKMLDESTIEVNPLYRFADIFNELFDADVQGMETLRVLFLDICMHYLAQLDCRSGMDRQDYYMRFVERDMAAGIYGRNASAASELFSDAESALWQYHLVHLYRTGEYREEFRRVVRAMYPNAFLYENNDKNNEILLYLGIKRTEAEEKKIHFLIDLFLPMQDKVFLFYEHHFGITGVEETMIIDEVMLF